MTTLSRKYRRPLAAALLAAFLAVWVLPAQACLSGPSQAAAQTGCPDCPCPCGQDGCAVTACAAWMLPSAMVATPSPGKALPAAIVFQIARVQGAATAVPASAQPSPGRPPATPLNIRFCSFQI